MTGVVNVYARVQMVARWILPLALANARVIFNTDGLDPIVKKHMGRASQVLGLETQVQQGNARYKTSAHLGTTRICAVIPMCVVQQILVPNVVLLAILAIAQ